VNALADAVRVTLGPKSKSVLIEKKYGTPTVCDDGVTIAKEMDLEDPVENLGAQMVRQAAERTGDAVGDGTSTSVILAQAIFADGDFTLVAAKPVQRLHVRCGFGSFAKHVGVCQIGHNVAVDSDSIGTKKPFSGHARSQSTKPLFGRGRRRISWYLPRSRRSISNS
jgi:hypothetical protein